MIKTKLPQIVDAQNGVSKVVYFKVSHELVDNLSGTRMYNVVSYIEQVNEQGQSQLVAIKENKAIFKESTIQALYGAMTLIEFQASQDALLIAQIDYVNSYDWTGDEAQKEPVKYWALTANDLEIVA